MGSYSQLLPSNIKGVGGIPPSLSECLLQDAASETLWNQTHDGLKAHAPKRLCLLSRLDTMQPCGNHILKFVSL